MSLFSSQFPPSGEFSVVSEFVDVDSDPNKQSIDEIKIKVEKLEGIAHIIKK